MSMNNHSPKDVNTIKDLDDIYDTNRISKIINLNNMDTLNTKHSINNQYSVNESNSVRNPDHSTSPNHKFHHISPESEKNQNIIKQNMYQANVVNEENVEVWSKQHIQESPAFENILQPSIHSSTQNKVSENLNSVNNYKPSTHSKVKSDLLQENIQVFSKLTNMDEDIRTNKNLSNGSGEINEEDLFNEEFHENELIQMMLRRRPQERLQDRENTLQKSNYNTSQMIKKKSIQDSYLRQANEQYDIQNREESHSLKSIQRRSLVDQPNENNSQFYNRDITEHRTPNLDENIPSRELNVDGFNEHSNTSIQRGVSIDNPNSGSSQTTIPETKSSSFQESDKTHASNLSSEVISAEQVSPNLSIIRQKSIDKAMEIPVLLIPPDYDYDDNIEHVTDTVVGQVPISDALKSSMKHEYLIGVDLTSIQKQLYHAYIQKHKALLIRSIKRTSVLNELLTNLQNICMHPYLLKSHLKCATSLEYFIRKQLNGKSEMEVMIQSSSKLIIVDKLLQNIINERREKAVIYVPLNSTLDLLQDFLECRGFEYSRFDRNSTPQQCMRIIHNFQTNPLISVLLLKSKPHENVLDLSAANNVIMYHSDYNPSSDRLSILNVCGPTQEKFVNVYRLFCRNTVEEGAFQLPIQKLLSGNILVNGKPNIFQFEDLETILRHGVSTFLQDYSTNPCCGDNIINSSLKTIIDNAIPVSDFKHVVQSIQDFFPYVHQSHAEFWRELFPTFVDIEMLETQFQSTDKFHESEANKFFEDIIKYWNDQEEKQNTKPTPASILEDELLTLLCSTFGKGESVAKRKLQSFYDFVINIKLSLDEKFPHLKSEYKNFLNEKYNYISEMTQLGKKRKRDEVASVFKRPRMEDAKKKPEGKSKRGRKSKLHVKQEIGERLVEFDGNKLFPIDDSTDIDNSGITTKIRFPMINSKTNFDTPQTTRNVYTAHLMEGTVEDSFTSDFCKSIVSLAPCVLQSFERGSKYE